MSFKKSIIFLFVLNLVLLGCDSKLLTVYKIDVQQGNAIEANDVNKITLGMTKEQVQYLLGTPIIIDSFHPDRWDYIYLFIPGYGERERRHLTLIFDRNEVIEIIKDNIVEDDVVADTEEKVIEIEDDDKSSEY